MPSPKHIHEESDAFTSDFCNNHSHPASPASLYLTSPRPRPTRPRVPYLMSSSPSSRVLKSQVPKHASRCPRPTFIHSPMRQTSYIRVVLLGLECRYVLMSNDIDVMVNFEYANRLNDEKVICQSFGIKNNEYNLNRSRIYDLVTSHLFHLFTGLKIHHHIFIIGY